MGNTRCTDTVQPKSTQWMFAIFYFSEWNHSSIEYRSILTRATPLMLLIYQQTFNFAENGRHLANQNYRSCIRQETGMCSIAYEPCTEQSFRIGQRNPVSVDNMQQDIPNVNMGLMGSGVNPMMTGSFIANNFNQNLSIDYFLIAAQAPVQDAAADQLQTIPVSEAPVENVPETAPVQDDQQVAADESTAEDVIEGSGGGDVPAPAATSFFSSLPSFQSLFSRQIFSYRKSRQYFSQCNDRITMPCIVEGESE